MNKWTFLILLSYLKLVFILINELTHELLTEKQCFPTWSSLSVTEICMWNIDMYAKHRPISTGASANNMDRLSPILKGNRILIYSTMVWSVASHVAESALSCFVSQHELRLRFQCRAQNTVDSYIQYLVFTSRQWWGQAAPKRIFVCPPSGACSQAVGV